MSETKGAEEAEAKVEKMFEYGYRKSNYGPIRSPKSFRADD